MSTQRIKIVTDTGLPERTRQNQQETWECHQNKIQEPDFFPEGSQILVGKDPFDPSYILFAVDDGMPGDLFVVSADVKREVYPTTGIFLKFDPKNESCQIKAEALISRHVGEFESRKGANFPLCMWQMCRGFFSMACIAAVRPIRTRTTSISAARR